MTRPFGVLAVLVVACVGAYAQDPEQQACEQGDVEACSAIANRHYDAGQDEDDPEEFALAVPYLKKACELGDGLSCNRMGIIYDEGFGNVEEDNALGQLYYQKACDAGNSYGCNNSAYKRSLGYIYPPGEQGPSKLAVSKCGRGNPRSCYEVAVAYLGREPLDEFAEKAAPYLEKACRGGDGQACVELAHLHVEGLGVAYDLALVQMYREKSCAAGSFVGCFHLGYDYQSGSEGAPKDGKQSQMYFQKACDLGWTPACGKIEDSEP